MKQEDMRAAMRAIGQEKCQMESTTPKEKKMEAKKSQYRNWRFGFVISCVPLFAVPLFRAFGRDIDVVEFLLLVFGGCEMIYVGVTLGIMSLNDYIKHRAEQREEKKILWNIFLITVGMALYVVMGISKEVYDDFNIWLAFGFNVAFIVIILLLGSAEYIQQIQEVE